MPYTLVSPSIQKQPTYRLVAPPVAPPAWSGSVLPFSKNANGEVSFDSNAGVLGAVKGLFNTASEAGQAIGDVASGNPVTTETVDKVIPLAAMATPINPAVRAGEGFAGALAPVTRAKAVVPSGPSLIKTADQQYKDARSLGVVYRPSAVANMAETVIQKLQREGIHPTDAPSTYEKLNMLANPPRGVTGSDFSQLESARKAFGQAAKNNRGKTDETAAGYAIRALDDFFENPTAESVLAGPADAVSAIVKDARGNYAAAMRSKEFVGREQKAIRRTHATYSGTNIDNKLRQRAADLLDSNKLSAGFSGTEKQAIDKFIAGNMRRNTARGIGNFLGGGGGLGGLSATGTGAGLGYAAGGPVGAAIGGAVPFIAGRTLKNAENRMAIRDYALIDELLRSRSPLAKEAKAPMITTNPEMWAALIRALMGGGLSEQGGGGGW